MAELQAAVSAQRHSPALTRLATASRRDIDPAATVASGPVDLQPPAPGRHPVVLGFKDVGNADPVAALAAMA
jgi:hypothetical protein